MNSEPDGVMRTYSPKRPVLCRAYPYSSSNGVSALGRPTMPSISRSVAIASSVSGGRREFVCEFCARFVKRGDDFIFAPAGFNAELRYKQLTKLEIIGNVHVVTSPLMDNGRYR